MSKLSILICTIPSRRASYGRLITELWSQMLLYTPTVGIIQNGSTELTIGEKRNWLLDKAQSEYVCFIDDDDEIAPGYIDLLMKAASLDCDCASLRGIITFNGKNPEVFEHSIKYKEWKNTTNEVKYERYPNHLNLIRTSIAKKFKFPETNHGEDHDWSTQIHKSGLLKKEYYIPDILYYYRKITNNVLAK